MVWYIQSCFKFSKPVWYLRRPIGFNYIKIIVFACTKPWYWYNLFHREVEAAIGTNQWHWLDCARPWLPWWVGFPFWLFRFAWVLTVSIYSKKCTTAQVGGRGFIPRRTKTLQKFLEKHWIPTTCSRLCTQWMLVIGLEVSQLHPQNFNLVCSGNLTWFVI